MHLLDENNRQTKRRAFTRIFAQKVLHIAAWQLKDVNSGAKRDGRC
jgi:hypothetical protein